MSPLFPKRLKSSDLEHPKTKRSKFNGDRWKDDQGFHSRGVTSSPGGHQVAKKEVVNGLIVEVDPMASEATGHAVKPAPTSVVVGGLMQGRHVPENNGCTSTRVGGSDA